MGEETRIVRGPMKGMIEAGEPLVQALHAMREYHEAVAAGRRVEDAERLRVLAESLFQA